MDRRELFKNHRLCMAYCTVLLLIDTFCIFLIARCLASFVEVLTDFSYQRGLLIVEKLGVLFALQLSCAFVKGRFWMPYRQRRTNELECTLYSRYLETPLHPDSEGKLSILCEKDLPECVGFYTEKLPGAVQAVAGIILYSVLLAQKERGLWIVGLLLAFGLIQSLPPLITEKYLVQNYIRAGQEEEKVRQELISGLSGMLTIKKLNLRPWFLERYRQRQREFCKIGERAAGTSSIQSALYSGAALVQQLGFLLAGSLLAASGSCPVSVLIEGYVLSSAFYQYIAVPGKLKAEHGTCRAAWERILQIFKPHDALSDPYGSLEMNLPRKGIWLVKGPNGSGKSTLFSILNGSRLSSARILQDANPNPLSRETLLRLTGWCPQMYLPLSDSLRQLLEMIPEGTLDAERLQICLTGFGVDSNLLDRPLNELSGGQQKKIALALALSKESGLLLLDEPEASLDEPGLECLRKLLKRESRPVLLATHTPLYDDLASGSIYVKGGLIHVQEK